MARYANKQNLMTLVEALRGEYQTPSWVKDAEELGSGLNIIDSTLTAAVTEHSDGSTAGPILSLSAKGWAEQNGTPSPESPVEIQVVRGHEVTGKTGRYVDLVVKQGNTTLSTTPLPLPSRGWVASLPDGTADTLTLDGAGKVTWEEKTGEATFDGSSDENWVTTSASGTFAIHGSYVGSSYNMKIGHNDNCYADRYITSTNRIADMGNNTFKIGDALYFVNRSISAVADFTTWLSTHPVTVLYPLATTVTEERGYVEMPEIPVGAEISIPELDDLGVDYIIPLPVVLQGYENRIAALEAAIAELATS